MQFNALMSTIFEFDLYNISIMWKVMYKHAARSIAMFLVPVTHIVHVINMHTNDRLTPALTDIVHT